MELIRDRYMLEEDFDAVLARARSHWDYATGSLLERAGTGFAPW
jgi:hypothetical protein